MRPLIPSSETNAPMLDRCREPYILLSNCDGCFRVPHAKIIYCNSYNSSTEFHIAGMRHLVNSKPIAHYEEMLAPYRFLRIHQSVLLNSAYLCHIRKGQESNVVVLTNDEKLCMARTKNLEVMRALMEGSIAGAAEIPNYPENLTNGRQRVPNSKISGQRKKRS